MRVFDLPRSDVSMQLDMGLLSCRLTKTARNSLGEHRQMGDSSDGRHRMEAARRGEIEGGGSAAREEEGRERRRGRCCQLYHAIPALELRVNWGEFDLCVGTINKSRVRKKE